MPKRQKVQTIMMTENSFNV